MTPLRRRRAPAARRRATAIAPAQRRLLEAVDRLAPEIHAVSRHLYLHPELSGEERAASELLAGRLERAGFRVERGAAGLPTAFVARMRRGGGARVAVLLEYDALPGLGHGCGHNLIAASGLGAGLALAARRSGWRGSLLVVGSPAEETFGGKAVLAEAGVFDGLDGALIVHGGREDRVFTESLACGSFEVVFRGRASHAVVSPEEGINALDALVQLYVGMDMLRKSLGGGVRIPGVILEGGMRPNVVPERAVGRFSVRAPTHLQRRAVHRRVVRLVEGIARATGTRVSIRPTDHPYLEMRTNRALAEAARTHFARLGRRTRDVPRKSMGSLDMGNVSHRAPAVHLYVDMGAGPVAAHTRAFARATQAAGGRRAAVVAAKVMALTALDLFTRPELRRSARSEFRAERAAATESAGGAA